MNRVMMIGRLTKDPKTTTTQSGVKVSQFDIAVSRRFANADGERETDFFRVVAWRQTAELCEKYLSKGKRVGVIGALQTRSWEADDGSKRVATEIIADEVEFLTPKSDGDSEPSYAAKKTAQLTPIEDDDLPF